MNNYLDLLEDVLTNGATSPNRTGVSARRVFGRHLEFDLAVGFPLVTTRRIDFDSMVAELLFFLSGETNLKYLAPVAHKWWKPWADSEGNLGPIYGHQWRNFGGEYKNVHGGGEIPNRGAVGVDQYSNLIEQLKTDPTGRRHVVTLWNPKDLPHQSLPCCHGTTIQFFATGRRLSCHMHQRSADVFLGLPVNIASYALLLTIVARATRLRAGKLTISLGDTHLYENHLVQANTQLRRRECRASEPDLFLGARVTDIANLNAEDIRIENYDPMPHIPAKVAI